MDLYSFYLVLYRMGLSQTILSPLNLY